VIVRADFDLTGQTPPPPYDLVNVLISWDKAIDGAHAGDSITTTLYDAGNNLLQSLPFTYAIDNPSSDGLAVALYFPSHIYTPSVGDYIILSNIVGSFELTSISPLARVTDNSGEVSFTPRVDSVLTFSSIPEPSTIVLLLIGLIGFVGIKKKIKA
jgi:hypothetical protein